MTTHTFVVLLLSICASNSAEITGWIYVDNWFQLYFNGEKVSEDPITFRPHNAVKISFTAPDSGLYSFAMWAQDYADDVTGLEDRNGGLCLGDGGIRIHLSDGTVSSSDWKCFITNEGPTNPDECGPINNECLPMDNDGSLCTVQYNVYPSCWNETECTEADTWSSATEYTDEEIGWGAPTQDSECCGLEYTGNDCNTLYYPNGCGPADQDWGNAVPIWTGDLNYDNRIICRYEYCVGGGTDCTAETVPTTAPTMATSSPSRSPLPDGQTYAPTASPLDGMGNGSRQSLVWIGFVFVSFITVIA